uniref:Polyprotein n=1 Tax=Ferraria betaflexivirus 1 TaxID=3238965 RepID=A0AB39AHA2_9VIRU
MAFSYRNPIEQTINELPTKYSDQILSESADFILGKVEDLNTLFSYAVSKEVEEYLSSHGLELAPLALQTHTHAASKMIENHLLFKSLPQMLKKVPSVAIMSMRDEKAKTFIKRRNYSKYGNIIALPAVNSCFDAKDLYRYQNPHELPRSHQASLEKLSSEIQKAGWTPKCILMHDELHFWRPDEILDIFSRFNGIENIIATVVFPVEVLLGEKESKNPRIYTFDIEGDILNFFPDGSTSEGYQQSIENSKWPFVYRSLQRGNLKVRVSILHTIGAHHIVSLDRYGEGASKIFFEKPPCLLNSELKELSETLIDGVIERKTMSSILLYLGCLKNPNRESALAKLRQLEKRSLFPDEAFIVSSVCTTFVNLDSSERLDKGLTERLKDKIKSQLPTFLCSWVDSNFLWCGKFRKFQKEIATNRFSLNRGVYSAEIGTSVQAVAEENTERRTLPASGPDNQASTSGNPTQGTNFLVNLAIKKYLEKRRRQEPQSSRLNEDVAILDEEPSDIQKESIESTQSTEPQVETEDPPAQFMIETRETCTRGGEIMSSQMQIQANEEPTMKFNERKNCCVFVALSHFLEMEPGEVISRVFNCDISSELYDAIEDDLQINLGLINECCQCLDVNCVVKIGENLRKLNPNGSVRAGMNLANNHATPMTRSQLAELMQAEPSLNGSGSVERFANHQKLPEGNFGEFEVNLGEALKLLRAMRRGATGIIRELDPSCIRILNEVEKVLSKNVSTFSLRKHQICMVLGMPGSGKTRNVLKAMLANPTRPGLVVSPRRFLADDWAKDLKHTAHKVFTFEAALMRRDLNHKFIVFDEVTLLPPGYLSLMCVMDIIKKAKGLQGEEVNERRVINYINSDNYQPTELIAVGDLCQTFYYSELDSGLLPKEHEAKRIANSFGEELMYMWFSHRLPQNYSELFGFECLGEPFAEKPSFFGDISSVSLRDYSAVLVASHQDKATINSAIAPLTFGEAQGLTFEKRVIIAISDHSMLVGLNGWLVATTRSRKGFDFVMATSRTLEEVMRLSRKRACEVFLKFSKIDEVKYNNLIGSSVMRIKPAGSLIEKAEEDPFIRPLIEPSHPRAQEISVQTVVKGVEQQKTHLPIITVDLLGQEIFEKMEAKEKREFFSLTRGMSEQFMDNEKGLKDFHGTFALRGDSIFPRHAAFDDVTFMEGVKKRIRFSNCREERRKLETVLDEGDRLAEFFISMLPGKFKVTEDDIEEGLNEFNEKRESKPAALWKSHSERSDIDWPVNHVFMFMKSQLCTKEEKMFTKAKAGQTLACFQHTVLFKFGPFLRAIEKAFIRAAGESYYIHSAKNFDDLNTFVITNGGLMQGNSIESDYEAFDSSQDHHILAFEVALLKKLGMSSGFISDYTSLKLNLGSRLGNFAIMRFTGEFCTFLFNTFANMLFTFMKYDINIKKDRLLFAGDDMASLGPLKERTDPWFQCKLSKLTLKAKEQVIKLPRFCGWILTPDGILKSPRLLWARVYLMSQRGLIEQCLDSYFLESKYAYNLGERLFGYLSENDIEYHYLLTRFFVKNRCKLQGLAREVAFGGALTFGSAWELSKSMTSLSELKTHLSKLIAFTLKTCMVTRLFLTPKCSTALDVMRATSRSVVQGIRVSALATSTCWTKLKLNTSGSGALSTRMSTLVRYLLESPLFSRISGVRRVLCTLLTPLRSMMSKASSLLSKLTSKRAQPTLLLDRSMCSPALMRLSRAVSTLSWNLKTSASLKIERSFLWTLVYYTEWRTRAGFFLWTMLKAGGPFKKYGAQESSNSGKEKEKFWVESLSHWRSVEEGAKALLGHLQCSRERELLERGSMRPELKEAKTEMFWLLSHQLKKLKLILKELLLSKEQINQMADVQSAIRTVRRRAVRMFVWTDLINVGNVYLPADVNYSALTDGQARVFRTFTDAYLPILFGNIAIFGSSPKTVWPDIAVTVPPVQARLGDNNINLNVQINLATAVPAMELWRGMHAENLIRKATLRQICEVYAPEAYAFLHASYKNGTVTNIYKKWPKAFEEAPWVVFDFASGLPMQDLTPGEKKTLDRLTKRLFRTENQKGVYEAGKEANEDVTG